MRSTRYARRTSSGTTDRPDLNEAVHAARPGLLEKVANLESAIALHMAYYNFCWRPGKMRITPAMAAGVTSRLWSFDDLMAGGRD